MARIRLGSGESARAFKGVICDDISEFESSLSGRVGVKRFQTPPSILVLMSLAGILASLRDRHSGPPMMGSEGCGGPISRYVLAVRLTGRHQDSKRTRLIHRPCGDIAPPDRRNSVFSYRYCAQLRHDMTSVTSVH